MGGAEKTFLVGQEPDLYIALGRLLLEFCAAEEFLTILGSAFTNGIQLTSSVTVDQMILEMGLERKVEETRKRIINELAEYHPHDFAAACGHDVRTAGEKLCS